MKTKKIVAIGVALVGVLSAGAAETLAAPLVVEQGFYSTFGSFCCGGTLSSDEATFSGDNFAVSNLGTHESNFFEQVFITGILDVRFGSLGPAGSHGTIQVGDVSCDVTFSPSPGVPDCGAALRFVHSPITIPPTNPQGFSGQAPFTMTGQLVLGRLGLPDLTVDIEGSGIVTGTPFFDDAFPFGVGSYIARYEFAVPEPSTVVLVLSGLVAVGWSRRRGKHLPLYPDAEPGRVA